VNSWRDRAECRKFSLDTMDGSLGHLAVSKRVCAMCPVKDACLAWAVDHAESWGVWGGLTDNERRRYAAGMPLSVCPKHRLRHVGQPCVGCVPPAPAIVHMGKNNGAGKMEGMRDLVQELADAGFTCEDTARIIMEETGVYVSEDGVAKARRRWNIRPNMWRHTRRDDARVELALRTRAGWTDLSYEEQADVYRFWLSFRWSKSEFCRVYKVSWSTISTLEKRLNNRGRVSA